MIRLRCFDLAARRKELRRRVCKQINEEPAIDRSAISGFEISLKVAKGKLQLPAPAKDWLAKIVEHHGLTVLPTELDVCIAAGELPRIHDDPCDRFMIAAVTLNDLPVVTEDE
ncbi:MAG: hypothetical protein DME65_13830 [Verrucomicrobia bacterium]|nr:MAG: hypothetical protein DME65_13830 [Verrucomicrobiota bacterium]